MIQLLCIQLLLLVLMSSPFLCCLLIVEGSYKYSFIDCLLLPVLIGKENISISLPQFVHFHFLLINRFPLSLSEDLHTVLKTENSKKLLDLCKSLYTDIWNLGGKKFGKDEVFCFLDTYPKKAKSLDVRSAQEPQTLLFSFETVRA